MGLIEEIDNFATAYNTPAERVNLAKSRAAVCDTCVFKAILINTTNQKSYCTANHSHLLLLTMQKSYNICEQNKFEESDKPFFGM
jgi:hypothetical protein